MRKKYRTLEKLVILSLWEIMEKGSKVIALRVKEPV